MKKLGYTSGVVVSIPREYGGYASVSGNSCQVRGHGFQRYEIKIGDVGHGPAPLPGSFSEAGSGLQRHATTS